MSCETFKTTLGGVEYSYTQLSATKSIKLKLRLIKTFGLVLPKLISGLGVNESEQITIFTNALVEMIDKNNEDIVTNLIIDCISPVQIGLKQIDVDKEFSGNLVNLYTLMFWVLKNEYESFLEEMTGLYEEVSQPVKTIVGLNNT